jgi:hypothetical protein
LAQVQVEEVIDAHAIVVNVCRRILFCGPRSALSFGDIGGIAY